MHLGDGNANFITSHRDKNMTEKYCCPWDQSLLHWQRFFSDRHYIVLISNSTGRKRPLFPA